jgi:hypothetical protein
VKKGWLVYDRVDVGYGNFKFIFLGSIQNYGRYDKGTDLVVHFSSNYVDALGNWFGVLLYVNSYLSWCKDVYGRM